MYACWEGTVYDRSCALEVDGRCPACRGELAVRPRPPEGIAAPPRSATDAPLPSSSPEAVEIERANAADLVDLTRLFEAYRKFYRMPADAAGAREFLSERLAHEESVIFLARRAGRAVGFVQLYPLFSSTRLGRLWLLNDLYVDEGERNSGVATQLLERAKELAVETDAVGVELDTAYDNPAQRLYEALGWKRDLEFFHYAWDRPI